MKNKSGLIGAVKAGQNWLKWDDNTYRQTLARLTGKTSAAKCSLAELENVREYMHQQGFPRTNPRHGRKPNPGKTKQNALQKIEALLADAGRPWDYAESIARRMFNIQKIDWLDEDQMVKLMQALIIDARRRNEN